MFNRFRARSERFTDRTESRAPPPFSPCPRPFYVSRSSLRRSRSPLSSVRPLVRVLRYPHARAVAPAEGPVHPNYCWCSRRVEKRAILARSCRYIAVSQCRPTLPWAILVRVFPRVPTQCGKCRIIWHNPRALLGWGWMDWVLLVRRVMSGRRSVVRRRWRVYGMSQVVDTHQEMVSRNHVVT